jgi:hypothetical protein
MRIWPAAEPFSGVYYNRLNKFMPKPVQAADLSRSGRGKRGVVRPVSKIHWPSAFPLAYHKKTN